MPHPGEKCLTEFELFFQSLAEPGPGVLPVSVSHRPGKPQRLARLLDGKPGEQVELSDPRRNRVLLPEPGEQFIQRQDEVGILRDGTDLIE
jgi:hypothetical protein